MPSMLKLACCPQAFLPVWFNKHTGHYNPGNTYTAGGLADSYYEYLLKMWIIKDRRVRPGCVLQSQSKCPERFSVCA